jgi:DNA mismatch repair protein MutS2
MGEEHLAALHPTADPQLLQERLHLTRDMMQVLQIEGGFPLEGIHDIRAALRRSKIERSILDPLAILQVGSMATTSRRISIYLQTRQTTLPSLYAKTHELVACKDLEDDIIKVLNESGEVKDSASNALKTIRRNLNTRKAELRVTLDRILREAAKNEFTGDEGMTLRNGRMVIPVRAEHKRKIQGFIHDVSATGHTVYLEPVEALHLNNEIRQLEIQESQEIERLLLMLTDSIRKYAAVLSQNTEIIGELDLLHAIARLSIRIKGTIPIWGASRLRLNRCYNPHLLLRKGKEGNPNSHEQVVPLDLDLDEDEKCLLITGPNAGGKSVALKALGLNVIMLQSGYAIPVGDGTEIPLFDRLFVDLGDDQSVEQDLSTFSSRLAWIRDTLDKSTPNSLILIDEAGTGTDPEEGAAIYQAFMETMIEQGSLLMATTHHGNLKIFAHDHPNAVNASMEFDPITLAPTYRFKKGVPGSSYAFEIAARIGVNKALIERAKSKIGKSKSRVESLILELQNKTREADLISFQAELSYKEAEKKKAEWETKQKALANEQTKIKQKALQEAKNIVLGAQKQIEQAIKSIKKSGGNKDTIKAIKAEQKKQLVQVDTELGRIEEVRLLEISSEPPVPGDLIRFMDGKNTGELLELNGNEAIVLVNGMRMKTQLKKLIKVTEKSATKAPILPLKMQSHPEIPLPVHVPLTLDIRGQRADEALKLVERYLDDALRVGLHQVEIIHGKGDGVLRKIVADHLNSRVPSIRKFYTPRWDMGGPGVTIVEL